MVCAFSTCSPLLHLISHAGTLHIDDVSVTQQQTLHASLPLLHASDNFLDCAADRAAAATWLIKKDFQVPPPSPHSSCLQVLPAVLKLGESDASSGDGIDVTLALQLSIDRLENIRTLLSVWDGKLVPNATVAAAHFFHAYVTPCLVQVASPRSSLCVFGLQTSQNSLRLTTVLPPILPSLPSAEASLFISLSALMQHTLSMHFATLLLITRHLLTYERAFTRFTLISHFSAGLSHRC